MSTWKAPFVFGRPDAADLEFLGGAPARWREQLREAARDQQWKALKNPKTGQVRREDMHGLERLDMVATSKPYRGKVPRHLKLAPPESRILSRILTGSFRPISRLYKARIADTPVCPWCDQGEEETKEHLFWQCPAWSHIRAGYLKQREDRGFTNTDTCREGTPALWYCGLCNDDPRIRCANGRIPPETHSERAPTTPADPGLKRYTTRVDHNGIRRRRVATDGSAIFPRDARLRRAGYGIWVGPDHYLNGAYILKRTHPGRP